MDIPLDRSSEDSKSGSAEQRGELPAAVDRRNAVAATGIKYSMAIFGTTPRGLTVGMMVLHSSQKPLA